MKTICLISLLFGLINLEETESQMNPNILGEKLTFKMEYLSLSVAKLYFQVSDADPDQYYLKVRTRATRSASLMFKLDNTYETYFNQQNFLPSKVVKQIRQKNIQHELNIFFDHQKNQASLGDSISWSIPDDCYDYFSMLYFLRNQKLNPGDSIQFHLDSEYIVSKVEVKVLSDHESVKVPAGKFRAIKLKVNFTRISHQSRPWRTDLLTNRLASPGSEISIWFSADENRLPLKIAYHQSKIKTQIVLDSFSRGQRH